MIVEHVEKERPPDAPIDAEFIGQAVIDSVIDMGLIDHYGPPDGGKEGHVLCWSGNAAEQIGTMIVRRFAPQYTEKVDL